MQQKKEGVMKNAVKYLVEIYGVDSTFTYITLISKEDTLSLGAVLKDKAIHHGWIYLLSEDVFFKLCEYESIKDSFSALIVDFSIFEEGKQKKCLLRRIFI